MMTVEIKVNDVLVERITAVNKSTHLDDVCEYKVNGVYEISDQVGIEN